MIKINVFYSLSASLCDIMTEVGALKPLLCSAWVNNSLQIVWLKWGTQCISLKLSSKIQSIAIVHGQLLASKIDRIGRIRTVDLRIVAVHLLML